jgi:hypothetical protein
MGPNAGKAKLVASLFAEFQEDRGHDSQDGLVTVYDSDGEILSNGDF